METPMKFRFMRSLTMTAAALALVGASAGAGYAQIPLSPASDPAMPEARGAVERYFNAADSGDPQAVRNTFWPDGRISGAINGQVVSWSAEDFANRNFKGTPSNSTDVVRMIEWIDVSGAGAVARVKVTLPGDRQYRDYFTLIRSNGVWKIGLKAFANP
jgi:hypothetical protein